METWWRHVRGFAMLGARRAGAEAELASALRLADRTGNIPGVLQSLKVLALGWARRGALTEAAVLSGYTSNFADQAYHNAGYEWVERQVDDALAVLARRSGGVSSRSAAHPRGATCSRLSNG
jgi:hypothetical protein